MQLDPLQLAPIDVPRIWGGQRFQAPAGSDPIGERWVYSTLPEHVSRISGGKYDGTPIDALCSTAPLAYLGTRLVAAGHKSLPLLVKLVDTSQPLSVQVHPSDELAHAAGLAQGKSEMWYVLDTTPASYILLGLKEDIRAEALREAALAGEIPHVLNRITPRPGDFYHVPAGQIHALGPGLLLLEVQQPSDATYRLYDWNRLDAHGKPRALDIPHALEVSSLTQYTAQPAKSTTGIGPIVDDPHFSVHMLPEGTVPYTSNDAPYLLFCAQGTAILHGQRTTFEARMRAMDLLFVPASCELTITVSPETELLMIQGPRNL